MNRAGVVLLCSLLIVASHSLATDYQKLSGYVRQFLSQGNHHTGLTRSSSAVDSPTLTAFLKVDEEQSANVCRQYGLHMYAQKGDIAIVSIPLGSLGPLSHHPAVHRIEASPSASLCMDTTAIIVGASSLHHSPFTLLCKQSEQVRAHPSPLTGKGVVLGIMDVGFDLTHPNFYDPQTGTCRIGAFWDQLSKDTVDSSLPVGRDFVGADAVKAQYHSIDGLIQTHGTHTLGIAAGSGHTSPYRGIAYDADLCIVSNAVSSDIELIDSADYYKYTSATDALGFKYIFDYADSLDKPCVASFSEGYPPYLDEEDSLFSAFLDSLTGPGRIIVAAAGNESYYKTYMNKPAGQEAAGAFIQTDKEQAFYRIKADGPLYFNVLAYADDKEPTGILHFASDSLYRDSLLTDTLFLAGDTITAFVDRYPSTFSADTVYNILLVANKALKDLCPLALVIEGTDTHAEVFGSSTYALTTRNNIDPQWNTAEVGHNVHAPGCFPSVICVGATAHRLGFINYQGEYKDHAAGRTIGWRSPYSSFGPTMNGLQKPDVMAPGDNIISSYSSYYLEANPDASDISSDVEHFDFQGRTYAWNANTGTSMACPVVAGVIALWLQAKPDLTREEIINAFSHTCRQPDTSLTYPNDQYGYGEIDAYRGLLYLLGIDGIEDVSRQHTIPRQQPVIYNLNGQRLSTPQKGINIMGGKKYIFNSIK